jgi:hypothetical protein
MLVQSTLTSSGGLRPHFFALSQRSKRDIPAQGPYFAVMSNTRRMSEVECELLLGIKPSGGRSLKGPAVSAYLNGTYS